MTKHRVLHVISGLDTGGAEMMLYKLVSASKNIEHAVVSLKSNGNVGLKLAELGTPVHTLELANVSNIPFAWPKYTKIVRQFRPHLIQGWMYHGNLFSSLASFFLRLQVPVLWNIRYGAFSLEQESTLTRQLIQKGGWLSRQPRHIIFNAYTSMKQHHSLGYEKERSIVIPNGFDLNILKPDPEARKNLHAELGISEDIRLIGYVARYHPHKDHCNFIKAATQLQDIPNVRFVLVGSEIDKSNKELTQLLEHHQLTERVFLFGERADIPEITSGLDIANCVSWTESFPNIVGEAMACGTPCVVTDVGDAAYVVDNTGIVVPPKNPQALALAWRNLLTMDADRLAQLAEAARQRIVETFSLTEVTRQYENLYHQIGEEEYILNKG